MADARFTPAARRDLEEIHTYTVSEWGMDQAVRYLRGLREAAQRLALFPGLGAKAAPGSAIRVWIYQRHRMIYRATNTGVEIARIVHVARNIDPLLKFYAS